MNQLEKDSMKDQAEQVVTLVGLMKVQSDNLEAAVRVLNTAERAIAGKFTVEIRVPVLNALGEHLVVRSMIELQVGDVDGSDELLSAIASISSCATSNLEKYNRRLEDLIPGLKTAGEIAEGD